MLTLLGPTAVGKTRLAALIAHALDGEIISADSRQVFRQMDLGTGKDREDYLVAGVQIPFHLIDIAEPGSEFSVFMFHEHFKKAYQCILSKGKLPVLCGGTGLYIESVLKNYDLQKVPVDAELHRDLEKCDMDTLEKMLRQYKPLHNTTDTETRERLQRAIEIEMYKSKMQGVDHENRLADTPVFGLRFEREENRKRISARLKERLSSGMIEEVQNLLDTGVNASQLIKYGLEYKFITRYLLGELPYNQMEKLLETAIHQFAKRQMTWFRRMEKGGIAIHWLDGEAGNSANLNEVLAIIHNVNNSSE